MGQELLRRIEGTEKKVSSFLIILSSRLIGWDLWQNEQLEQELRAARKDFEVMGRHIQAQGRIIQDHTSTFKMMQETIHFQASYIGELGDDLSKVLKDLVQLQETSFVKKEAYDKEVQEINRRITRRREEFDGVQTFVGGQDADLTAILTTFPAP